MISFDLLAHQPHSLSDHQSSIEIDLNKLKLDDLTLNNLNQSSNQLDLNKLGHLLIDKYHLDVEELNRLFHSCSIQQSASFGMPQLIYPLLGFQLSGLYTLGSPISLFLIARGIPNLSSDFCLPTCSRFFNIYHPYDPVAYRLETLIDPKFEVSVMIILIILIMMMMIIIIFDY